MIRGTTPTHTFTLPFDTSTLKEVKITYSQDGKPIVVKRLSQCTFEGNKLSVRLTQQETFLFNSRNSVKLQMRLLSMGGDVVGIQPKLIDVVDVDDEELLE